jgi:hypothetical protein
MLSLLRSAVLLLLVVLFVPFVRAQDTPAYEIFGGGTYLRQDVNETPDGTRVRFTNGIGWHGSLTGNANSWLGAVFDFSGTFSNPTFGFGDLERFNPPGFLFIPDKAQINTSTFTYLFGPRFSYRSQRFGRFTPFAETLFGAATFRVSSNDLPMSLPGLISNTSFSAALGGGVDARINHRVTVRLFDVDYLLARVPVFQIDPTTGIAAFGGNRRTQNNIRASVGVVFNIGSK